MRSLKKSILMIMAAIMVFFITSSTIEAKNITSVNATASNGKITVSGTTEAGTLACAVMVYDETGANLVGMETCGVAGDNTYSYTLEMKFTNGTYVIKVADYDGGSYTTTNVTVSDETEAGTNAEESSEAGESSNTGNGPDTGDTYNMAILFSLILISGAGMVLACRKKAN